MTIRKTIRNSEWPPAPYRCPECRGRQGPDQPGHEPGCALAEHVRAELAGARERLDRAKAAV